MSYVSSTSRQRTGGDQRGGMAWDCKVLSDKGIYKKLNVLSVCQMSEVMDYDTRFWFNLLRDSKSPFPDDNVECAGFIHLMLKEKKYPCNGEGLCRIKRNELRRFMSENNCTFHEIKVVNLQELCRENISAGALSAYRVGIPYP